jgi:hypothetical protein
MHMNAKTMWMSVGDVRAQIVRIVFVLMVGAIALTILGSLASSVSRLARNNNARIMAAASMTSSVD